MRSGHVDTIPFCDPIACIHRSSSGQKTTADLLVRSRSNAQASCRLVDHLYLHDVLFARIIAQLTGMIHPSTMPQLQIRDELRACRNSDRWEAYILYSITLAGLRIHAAISRQPQHFNKITTTERRFALCELSTEESTLWILCVQHTL